MSLNSIYNDIAKLKKDHISKNISKKSVKRIISLSKINDEKMGCYNYAFYYINGKFPKLQFHSINNNVEMKI